MTTQQLQLAPPDWPGSLPEYIVFRTLEQNFGLKVGVHFTYQSPLLGGRIERGGVVIDFLFSDPPDLAINVQGEFFHQEQGAAVIARDRLARAQLAGQGITLIFIDAEDALSDPRRHVGDALRYRDNSFLGGIGG